MTVIIFAFTAGLMVGVMIMGIAYDRKILRNLDNYEKNKSV